MDCKLEDCKTEARAFDIEMLEDCKPEVRAFDIEMVVVYMAPVGV